MFSIVVPVFNSEKYLKECVDSVMQQTYNGWELILVDDGSTDNSINIINDYVSLDKRIKKVTVSNRGAYFARIKGFEIAEKEYIICLDSDDYWENNSLEKLYEILKSDNTDIIMFAGRTFGDEKKERKIGCLYDDYRIIEKKELYLKLLTSHELNSLCLKVFKKKLLEKEYVDLKAYTGLCIGEDKVQVLRLFTAAEKVIYIPDVLYNYRKKSSSENTAFNINNIPKLISNEVFEVLFSYMEYWGMYDKKYKKIAATYYIKNFIDQYYTVRKKMGKDKKYRQYDWKGQILPQMRKYLYNNNLNIKDKIKLILMLYFNI